MFGEIEQSNRQKEQYKTQKRFLSGFFAFSE